MGEAFQIQVAGVVDDGFTSAEVSYSDETVAVVYERADGWRTDLFHSPRGLPLPELLTALQSAQDRLSRYVNRRGENPPEGLTRAGMSLWLMEKVDGTAMGVRLSPQSE
ncbi:MAG: hypothetical protein KF873_04675 [Gemmataceae bacterium]|nr:hypothetical protein [Gemmataceae bacterium]